MRTIILVLLSVLACCQVKAQADRKKDSLLQLIPTAKDDSTRIMLLIRISSVYATGNFDSSLLYMNKAKDLAEAKRVTSCDQYINTAFSQYHYYNNDYKSSTEFALKNLSIAEKSGDEKLLAKTYNNLAAIYNHFGNHKSAIDYALKCLALSEKTKDSASFPIRNLTASATYYNLKQYDKSIYYSRRAIEFGQKFNNSFAVMMGLNNMGASYSGMHKIDSAIATFTEQLAFAQREEDVVNTCYALINLCHNHFINNDLAAVEKYAAMLNTVSSGLPDKNTEAEIKNVNALRFILRKEYSLAKAELDSGLAVAKRENAADALGNLYQTYSKFYYTQHKVKEAEDYTYLYDSLQSIQNIKELNFYIEEIETKYETEKKENQITLQQSQLKQQSIINYFLIAGAAAILLISLLVFRNYRNRQKLQQVKIDELETEKQLTATEAVLRGEEKERTRLAKDLHDGLGGMLSGIKFSLNNMKENLIMTPDNAQAFARSVDMLDSSIREMRRVAHNMMPEVLVKYGLDKALKEYCAEIDRSAMLQINYQAVGLDTAEINEAVSISVYRIVQELVNNAIKHAAAQNMLVQLHYTAEEKMLAVTVEDDGKGFDTAILQQSNGIGWSNIQSRVDLLKGKMDLQSAQGKGTSVMIEINNV
jgi:two-component system, NarL family, sensor kinase